MGSTETLSKSTALTFESRMADTTVKLLRRQGVEALSAPSMQEVPLENHSEVFTFADQLFAGEIDILLCMTGVGTDMLVKTMKTRYKWEQIHASLSDIIVVSRGPKPAKVLRDLDIPINIKVPEPNTWKELLETLDKSPETADLKGKKVAIQEYGETNEQLNEELKKRGAELVHTSIYRWALPDDLEPLKEGIQYIVDGKVDAALFTSKTQVHHVMKVADSMDVKESFLEALKKVTVASIGPVCSKGLETYGIEVDFEPSRPKLAIFVNELADELA
ncbi:uroporphyrinogen-III synthase [Gracilimonas mengyeensis]|uniref:Uroporphyrinogen-III synthase n=1 Tax=Gracilimonas mengyeensis TaxID=1302730 RepID=A0A521BM91_9BACT|nr:uroporphyrinogen-III synthase [Gracilimonas mengyeensis]SMO47750.1 uroporphyrinogen-III synthase [Gracilimonas mengyeensis]